MIDPILDMLNQGGWVLVGIVLVSIVAWSLILGQWTRLRERTAHGWEVIEQAVEDLHRGGSFDLMSVSTTGDNIVGRLLQSDVIHFHLNRRSFEAQVLPLLNRETVLFERSLRLIAVLAASMPLLGLLGTVLGMIQTFAALTEQGVAEVNGLAGGISQALITTQAGLVIAVPILLVHGYLGARIRRYLDEVNVMMKKVETAVCCESDLRG